MGNVCLTPLEGGEIVIITVPNPGGTSDWIYSVPAGYEMTLLSVTWQVSTSALVGDRYIGYFSWGPVADAVLYRMLTVFTTVIIAGQSRAVVLCLQSSRTNQNIVNHYHDSLPEIRYTPGMRWGGTWAGSSLPGDQFFNIVQTVIRWRV